MKYKTLDQMTILEKNRVIRTMRDNAKERENNIFQDVTLNSVFI